MKYIYNIFIVSMIFCSNSWGQLQFSEQATMLGCENSTYGEGNLGGGIYFFLFEADNNKITKRVIVN